MGKRDQAAAAAQASVAWVTKALDAYSDGVHRLGEPAYVLDSELPVGLAEIYRTWDGLELFHETLVLWPSRKLQRRDERLLVGEVQGDDLLVDSAGLVWRLEEDSGELVCDGSSFDRWLAGFVEAEAVLYERDGEFKDGVIDEDGDLLTDAAISRERAALSRDKKAVGPRWRLARHLVRRGDLEQARAELEEVVEAAPGFSWAWYDLGRISEQLGQLEGACDELEAGATAVPGYVYNGFFWAQLARIAVLRGDEALRKRAAAKAVECSPQIVRQQLEGARERLASGDEGSSRELAETARAVAPGDLQVLDYLRQLDGR